MMLIMFGVYELYVVYVLFVSEYVWGVKGDWAGKSARDCYLEE